MASPIAVQKQWAITYFSTTSSTGHEAYALWNGEQFNKGRKESQQVAVNLNRNDLRRGEKGKDGIYRKIITLDDAIKGGCDLIDKEQIEQMYSPDAIKQLFNAHFVNDKDTHFPYSLLKRCLRAAPITDKERATKEGVLVGIDPARSCDRSVMTMVLPPNKDRKGLVLEMHEYINLPFDQQAKQMIQVMRQYNVQNISLDVQGAGIGLLDCLQTELDLPIQQVSYHNQQGERMIAIAKNLFRNGRLQWPIDYQKLSESFMLIRQAVNDGRRVNYQTRRTDKLGHGDHAWALMLALNGLSMTGDIQTNQIEVYGG